jgi:hypothetical protein
MNNFALALTNLQSFYANLTCAAEQAPLNKQMNASIHPENKCHIHWSPFVTEVRDSGLQGSTT